jgi:hypothetical protein
LWRENKSNFVVFCGVKIKQNLRKFSEHIDYNSGLLDMLPKGAISTFLRNFHHTFPLLLLFKKDLATFSKIWPGSPAINAFAFKLNLSYLN